MRVRLRPALAPGVTVHVWLDVYTCQLCTSWAGWMFSATACLNLVRLQELTRVSGSHTQKKPNHAHHTQPYSVTSKLLSHNVQLQSICLQQLHLCRAMSAPHLVAAQQPRAPPLDHLTCGDNRRVTTLSHTHWQPTPGTPHTTTHVSHTRTGTKRLVVHKSCSGAPFTQALEHTQKLLTARAKRPCRHTPVDLHFCCCCCTNNTRQL